jgi:hypothetical protein
MYGTYKPARGRKQVKSRNNPTEVDEAARIERIAVNFLFTMIAEERYVRGCGELFQTGDHMDQRRVVDAVVKRLHELGPIPNIDPLQLRCRIWRDLLWRGDLRNLEPRGSA